MNREIKNGALLSYLMIFFNIITGLLYTPWMVHTIGKAEYGIYTLAMTFLAYFIMDFGLGSAVSKFISQYRVEDNVKRINEVLGMIFKIYIAISALILVVLCVLYGFVEGIFSGLTPDEIQKFKVVYLIAGAYSVFAFPFTPLNGILTSYEKFTVMKFCDLLNKFLTVGLMIMALMSGYRLYSLVIVNALVGLLIIAIKLEIIRRSTPIKVAWSYWDGSLLRDILSFSIWMTLMGIASRLIITVAPTVLGIFADSSAIAEFSVATTIESYVFMFANALNGLFLPRVTALNYEDDGNEKVLNLMIKVGRIQLVIVGIIIIGFAGVGKTFVCLWMGRDYISSYYTALCLIVPGLVSLTQEIAYTKMIVENKIKYRALLFLCVSLISLSIGCALSPRLGSIGCGLGILTALVLGHVVGMNILYKKQLELDVNRFFRECHLQMAIPLAITLLMGLLINHYFSAHSYVELAIQAFAIFCVYITFVWILFLNSEEKSMIRTTLRRFGR